MILPHQCKGCFARFKEERHMLSHQTQVAYCRKAVEAMQLSAHLDAFVAALDDFDGLDSDPSDLEDDVDGPEDDAVNFDDIMDDFLAALPRSTQSEPSARGPQLPTPEPVAPIPRTEPRTATFDVFPNAGRVIREETPVLERWAKKHGHADNPYHPFKNKLEWDIGRWAKTEGPGATSFDRLLGFDSVSFSFGTESLRVSHLSAGCREARSLVQNVQAAQPDHRPRTRAHSRMEDTHVPNGWDPRRDRSDLP